MKDVAREVVAALLEVADRLDLATVGLVVDVREDVQRLEDPAVERQGVAELGRVAGRGEHPDDVMRADRTGMNRRDEPHDVRPMAPHPLQIDLAARRGIERAVVGAEVDAPQLGVGQIGKLWAVGEAEQGAAGRTRCRCRRRCR